MHMLWKLLFPLAMPFWTFAEGDPKPEPDPEPESEPEPEPEPEPELDADALKTEMAKMRDALKKANAEAKERRLQLKKYEDEEDKRKKAAMGDLEKAQTMLAEVTADRDGLNVKLADLTIRHAIEIGAAGLQFVDPKDAFNLIDLGEIEIDEDTGEVSGVEKALKELVKAKPYLIATSEDDSPGTPSKGGKRKVKKDALPERPLAVL